MNLLEKEYLPATGNMSAKNVWINMEQKRVTWQMALACIPLNEKETVLQQKEKEIAKSFPEESTEVEEIDNGERVDLEKYMKSLQEQIAQDVNFLYNEKCCKDMAKVLTYDINT